MALDQTMIKRLAFVKYLFNSAISQSKAPAPLSSASILYMHDAAEFFLGLACEHLNVRKRDIPFMGYWDVLNKKLPSSELQQQESMRRLNKARRELKHHGTFPSELDIETFRTTTTSFFQDNVPLIFGVNLDEISLIEFVNPESAREKLLLAQTFIKDNDFQSSQNNIAVAFEEMILDYESRKGRYPDSPFFFGMDISNLDSFSMGLHDSELNFPIELHDFFDKVVESIGAIQEAIKILALGIDYRKYSKFKHLTPSVTRYMDGKFRAHYGIRHLDNLTPEDINFCIDFVIEAALILATFDYSIKKKKPTIVV